VQFEILLRWEIVNARSLGSRPPVRPRVIRGAARRDVACAATAALLLVAVAVWWPAQHERAKLEDTIGGKRRELVQAQQADELLRAYGRAAHRSRAPEKKLEHAATSRSW